MIRSYWLLMFAILAEIAGSAALKSSHGMTRLGPSLAVVVLYPLTFWCLAVVLKTLPLGIVSALWAGLGMMGTVVLGMIVYRERLGWIELVGIVLILAGVLVLSLCSKAMRET